MKRFAVLALVVACGGDESAKYDACAAATDPCFVLHVAAGSTSTRVEALQADIVYGSHHATTMTTTTVDLPAEVAVTFSDATTASVDIVIAAMRGGHPTGFAAGSIALADHDHLDLELSEAPTSLRDGALACGGTVLPGEPHTLYTLSTERVPVFYARCRTACITSEPLGAVCMGAGLCHQGGLYCGGDKLDGNPNTLYKCGGGGASNDVVMTCANGCTVAPAGSDDFCKP